MKETTRAELDLLIRRYPVLGVCEKDILAAYELLEAAYRNVHKLLVAGNGGSCADGNHIVGELMKGFKKRRPLDKALSERLISADPTLGEELARSLQQGLPAIALSEHQGLNTAFCNDVPNGGLLTYAQQICGFGEAGDVFLAISTSGNAKNLQYAAVVAKAKGIPVILLAGKDGGALRKASDVAIVAPSSETYIIQELYLPIYHALCLMLENELFDE